MKPRSDGASKLAIQYEELESAYRSAVLGGPGPDMMLCGALGRGCVVTKSDPPCQDCPLLPKPCKCSTDRLLTHPGLLFRLGQLSLVHYNEAKRPRL